MTYLCGFNHVDIIQLDKGKHIIQHNAFYIYTLTCPKLRLLWNSTVLLDCEIFWNFFLEIVEGFNSVLVALGKGSCRVWNLGKFLEGSIYFLGTLGKGSCRVSNLFFLGGSNPGKRESANLRLLLDYFLFFWGGKPWKRESIDLRLRWDYFLKNFYRRQALKNAVWRFEIALGFCFRRQALKNGVWRFEIALGFFFRRQALKNGVWRFEVALFFLKAALGKGSLEVWDCFGITFYMFFWEATLEAGSLEIWDCFGTIFFWEATLGKGNPEIWDCFGIIF